MEIVAILQNINCYHFTQYVKGQRFSAEWQKSALSVAILQKSVAILQKNVATLQKVI
jgi:hypothetical protein